MATKHPGKTNTASAANAMGAEEIAAFLAEKREARLATVRGDGTVHLTPVWYLHEHGKVKFCLEVDRLHLTNLRRAPHATVLVDEDRRPSAGWLAGARAVMFAGPVEIIDDLGATEQVRLRLLGRYIDTEGSPFRNAQKGPPKQYVLVVLTPERTLSWDFTKPAR